MPEAKTAQGDTILSDETIILGSPNNRTGDVLKGMRLLTYKTSKGKQYKLITDRHDLASLEVVLLYRKRWQIELYLRWLRRALGVLHQLGRSQGCGVADDPCSRYSGRARFSVRCDATQRCDEGILA